MRSYRDIFPGRHTFLAVIHVDHERQTLDNIAIAQDNGAGGVFLINHSIRVEALLHIYEVAHRQFPSFWMGLNMLGSSPLEALGCIPSTAAGLWVDNAGVDDSGVSSDAQNFSSARRASQHWRGLLFGGIAFKHQPKVIDPAQAARAAIPHVDIITTSGSRTGSAPDPKKIEAMRSAIGTHPLAIASGITPSNVGDYMDHADCFLVATGISRSFTELDPKLVRKLARALAW